MGGRGAAGTSHTAEGVGIATPAGLAKRVLCAPAGESGGYGGTLSPRGWPLPTGATRAYAPCAAVATTGMDAAARAAGDAACVAATAAVAAAAAAVAAAVAASAVTAAAIDIDATADAVIVAAVVAVVLVIAAVDAAAGVAAVTTAAIAVAADDTAVTAAAVAAAVVVAITTAITIAAIAIVVVTATAAAAVTPASAGRGVSGDGEPAVANSRLDVDAGRKPAQPFGWLVATGVPVEDGFAGNNDDGAGAGHGARVEAAGGVR